LFTDTVFVTEQKLFKPARLHYLRNRLNGSTKKTSEQDAVQRFLFKLC
jgi:hypothetical protein